MGKDFVQILGWYDMPFSAIPIRILIDLHAVAHVREIPPNVLKEFYGFDIPTNVPYPKTVVVCNNTEYFCAESFDALRAIFNTKGMAL